MNLIKSPPNPSPGKISQVVNLGAGEVLRDTIIDGSITEHTQPMSFVTGIFVRGKCATLENVEIRDCPGHGIAGEDIEGLTLKNVRITNTSHYSVWLNRCPRTKIEGCELGMCGFSNIFLLDSPLSAIEGNQIGPSGPVGVGIYPQRSKDLKIRGNNIERCRGGIEAWNSLSEQESGLEIEHNDVNGNYNGGISVSSNGARVIDNRILDNGTGGIISNGGLSTEPGIKLDIRYPGEGYKQGDILTLVGGVGTKPARVMVCLVWGGKLFNVSSQDTAIYPITMGDYEVPPTNPVDVEGGHGTGAKLIYTRHDSPGMRYSQNHSWTYGLATIGPMHDGLFEDGRIESNLGAGIAFAEFGPNFMGKAYGNLFRGNTILDNEFSVKGKSNARPFDDIWPASNVFENNTGYP